ncbi:Rv2175c family DNA-binding protein [Gleimia sp. 6138-11-ORH1]|uniref:Rv2175c family DNA-binding protein n=1 Tax=Gleimia sp. 6138-11-ORH1 TaxID=2973937 RepID=UPI0021673719|nr:Rv2175c family DNA-binding protein [Gleimia sp. 6138-11-ORH1]MCS4484445.1 Rv2175c family DNA-binding protein [Gleimia sp. 6138-11-ORH1]
MTNLDAYYTQNEAAQLLGVTPRRIKQMWQEDELPKVYVDRKPLIPKDCFVKSQHGWIVHPQLRGTLIMLQDAGFEFIEAGEWLDRYNPALEARPLELLAQKRVKELRTLILTLTF